MRNKLGRGHIMQVGTCEQWVCVLLIILCMQCSLASWLEDIKEQLTASLTVFHRVVTLHRHEQRNQVWHRYGAVDSSVYKKQKHTVKTRLNEVSFLKTESRYCLYCTSFYLSEFKCVSFLKNFTVLNGKWVNLTHQNLFLGLSEIHCIGDKSCMKSFLAPLGEVWRLIKMSEVKNKINFIHFI